MTTTRKTLVKGTTLLSATLGLSFGFVALPSVTTSTPTKAPAKNSPVTPQTNKHSLADKALTTVGSAGPQTKVVQDSSVPKDAAGKPVTTPGKVAVDPTLEAGAADDTVVSLKATGDMVGVTWPGTTAMAPKATVAVRAKNGAGWQDWQELSINPVTDQKSGAVIRYGTDPLWVDGATDVQVRVAPEAKALLKTASVSAVTSPETAADAQLTPTAVAGAANAAFIPSVVSRAGWGANESLRKGCVPTINPTTKVVVVHHTAGSNSYSKAQSASIIRGIYAYDTGSLGWCDVAYNMIVDKYGQKFEGRFGGLNRSVKGAHADSFNTRTFGISILGNYDTTAVPAAGMRALEEGVAMRLSQFYINPYGKTTLYSEYTGTTSRYPKGAAYLAKNVAAHRESSQTACPGRYLYPRMGELTTAAAQLAGWNNGYPGSPIWRRYTAAGGSARYGYVTTGERTIAPGLQLTDFSGAHIYNSSYGAKIIGHGLNASWISKGGVNWGGYPWTDEIAGPGGWYVELSKGKTLTYSRSAISTWTEGAIRNYWVNQAGGMWGSLGAPIAKMVAIRGGYQQQFAGGVLKYDSATGHVWKA